MTDYITMVLYEPLTTSGVTTADIIIFLAIIIVSVIIAKIVSIKLKRQISDKVPAGDRENIGKIVSVLIVILGFIIALPHLNVNLSGIFVAGGVFAIIIGIAGQSFFSNVISGMILFFERPIKIGDNVGIGDTMGTVEDIQILSTVIKTYDGVYTRIPNQTMFVSDIKNYVAHVARRFEYIVGIRYEDDAEVAIRIIKEVIWKHPFALKRPEPSVFVDQLGDNSVNICVRIWAPSSVWWDVRTELLWKIKVALEAEGIQIPFPQRTVWFPDGVKGEASLNKIPESDNYVRENPN